jgi:adenylate kinase family enzyme
LFLGGPASGKGTQCEKLVEEFGYKHISTGALMRAETQKGTKIGDDIAAIQKAGGLVPYQITVQLLINALIANPSKNYLIDGFPRAVDQATHFESEACEA